MQQEKDPLNLGSLPLVSPPGDDWPVIEAALRKQNSRKRIVAVAGGMLALAACAVLAVGIFVYRPHPNPADSSVPEQRQTAQVGAPVLSQASRVNTLESLIGLSQQMESNLLKLRSQVGVLPTSSVIYQVEFEDLVAQVDGELSMHPDSTELWSQRVNLMLDLSQLYQNELRREYHRMASL